MSSLKFSCRTSSVYSQIRTEWHPSSQKDYQHDAMIRHISVYMADVVSRDKWTIEMGRYKLTQI
ncbi:hypothetical protein CHS0354_014212, partial [Potamilus streckersoni]